MSPFTATLRLPVPLPVFIVLATLLLGTPSGHAASTLEIKREVDKALVRFQQFDGARAYLDIARGVLVFPKVYKVGIGGEYGEGALRVDGKTVDYYSTAAASSGFQPRAQAKTLIVLFTREDALSQFRASEAGKPASTVRSSWSSWTPARRSALPTSRTRWSALFSARKA